VKGQYPCSVIFGELFYCTCSTATWVVFIATIIVVLVATAPIPLGTIAIGNLVTSTVLTIVILNNSVQAVRRCPRTTRLGAGIEIQTVIVIGEA
jgi:hypothetical protein